MDLFSWLIVGTVVLVGVVLYKFSNSSSKEDLTSSSVETSNTFVVAEEVVVEPTPVVEEVSTEVSVKKVRKPRVAKPVAKPVVKTTVKTAKKKTSKKKNTLKVV